MCKHHDRHGDDICSVGGSSTNLRKDGNAEKAQAKGVDNNSTRSSTVAKALVVIVGSVLLVREVAG